MEKNKYIQPSIYVREVHFHICGGIGHGSGDDSQNGGYDHAKGSSSSDWDDSSSSNTSGNGDDFNWFEDE